MWGLTLTIMVRPESSMIFIWELERYLAPACQWSNHSRSRDRNGYTKAGYRRTRRGCPVFRLALVTAILCNISSR
ncbi:hypothetical protein L208DRAFT_338458 [Tricholoma matsutake]|nr:hypothetical protein L208DRAFT_338458 [Tricholoma matsutake 945]